MSDVLRIADELRAMELISIVGDSISYVDALSVAIQERISKEQQFSEPKEAPKESYEQEYVRLKRSTERL